MRKTKSWKHNRKDRHQYRKNEYYGWYFDPYYDPLSEGNIDKRNTPFMNLSDIGDEEDDY